MYNTYNNYSSDQKISLDKLISINTQVIVNPKNSNSLHSNNSHSNNGAFNNNTEVQVNTNSKNMTGNGTQSSNKGYNNKIQNYFRQSSTVKDNKLTIKNNNINDRKKPNIEELMSELEKLKQELEETNQKLTDKELELNNSNFNYSTLHQLYDSKISECEAITEAKERATESLITSLRELEENKRTKIKAWISSETFKLGKYRTQSHGMNITQIWEDGHEILSTKQELEYITKQKEEEKKNKKKIPSGDYDRLENHKYKLEKILKKEQDIKDKLVKLYKDRITLEYEDKRLGEEIKSNYAKKNWPVIDSRYLILSLIGKGGYSEVYKAYDLHNHSHVACKIHQLDSQWSEGIKELYIRHTLRENKIHEKIDHDNVVKHYDTVEIDNSSFATVLELCSGPDLANYLKQNGHLSEREAKIIIKQIIIGLKELHSMGIIHYDLKPQNIIFNNGDIKISDFGLAKEMSDKEKIELTCLGVGTYYYLPPETFDPSRNTLIDQKVDIWSVGVIFFELLYGFKPFGHNLSQDRILKDNLIWNGKPIEFPSDSKINISQSTKVSIIFLL